MKWPPSDNKLKQFRIPKLQNWNQAEKTLKPDLTRCKKLMKEKKKKKKIKVSKKKNKKKKKKKKKKY